MNNNITVLLTSSFLIFELLGKKLQFQNHVAYKNTHNTLQNNLCSSGKND